MFFLKYPFILSNLLAVHLHTPTPQSRPNQSTPLTNRSQTYPVTTA